MVAVLGWFKFKKKSETPLTGAPLTRRLKTYSAESGYVYQYCFAGQRPAAALRSGSGTEFAFDICFDRKTQHRVWVFVADTALAGWMASKDRTLTNSERYGVAKLALRNAFDQRAPSELAQPVAPDAEEVEVILDELGV